MNLMSRFNYKYEKERIIHYTSKILKNHLYLKKLGDRF